MELEEFYKKNGSDFTAVLRRFCGDGKIVGVFVKSFPKDPSYQRLSEAVAARDYPAVEQQAHALKGVAANLGLDRLQAACGELVLAVRQDRNEAIFELFQKVEALYQAIIEDIPAIA